MLLWQKCIGSPETMYKSSLSAQTTQVPENGSRSEILKIFCRGVFAITPENERMWV